jgi:hypothetical protein
MKTRYRVTVEPLSNTSHPPLVFEAESHDDVLALVERARTRGDVPAESVPAFIVGLKLFGGVMLSMKGHPLFAGFAPHFREFMGQLKQGPQQAA